MKILILLLCLLLAGCTDSVPEETTVPTTAAATVPQSPAETETTTPAETVCATIPYDPIKEIIGDMSLQERI